MTKIKCQTKDRGMVKVEVKVTPSPFLSPTRLKEFIFSRSRALII